MVLLVVFSGLVLYVRTLWQQLEVQSVLIKQQEHGDEMRTPKQLKKQQEPHQTATKQQRCGPLFESSSCNCVGDSKYCNEGPGWCGDSEQHKSLSSGTYDCKTNRDIVPPLHYHQILHELSQAKDGSQRLAAELSQAKEVQHIGVAATDILVPLLEEDRAPGITLAMHGDVSRISAMLVSRVHWGGPVAISLLVYNHADVEKADAMMVNASRTGQRLDWCMYMPPRQPYNTSMGGRGSKWTAQWAYPANVSDRVLCARNRFVRALVLCCVNHLRLICGRL